MDSIEIDLEHTHAISAWLAKQLRATTGRRNTSRRIIQQLQHS
jgi:hypothetical protein